MRTNILLAMTALAVAGNSLLGVIATDNTGKAKYALQARAIESLDFLPPVYRRALLRELDESHQEVERRSVVDLEDEGDNALVTRDFNGEDESDLHARSLLAADDDNNDGLLEARDLYDKYLTRRFLDGARDRWARAHDRASEKAKEPKRKPGNGVGREPEVKPGNGAPHVPKPGNGAPRSPATVRRSFFDRDELELDVRSLDNDEPGLGKRALFDDEEPSLDARGFFDGEHDNEARLEARAPQHGSGYRPWWYGRPGARPGNHGHPHKRSVDENGSLGLSARALATQDDEEITLKARAPQYGSGWRPSPAPPSSSGKVETVNGKRRPRRGKRSIDETEYSGLSPRAFAEQDDDEIMLEARAPQHGSGWRPPPAPPSSSGKVGTVNGKRRPRKGKRSIDETEYSGLSPRAFAEQDDDEIMLEARSPQ